MIITHWVNLAKDVEQIHSADSTPVCWLWRAFASRAKQMEMWWMERVLYHNFILHNWGTLVRINLQRKLGQQTLSLFERKMRLAVAISLMNPSRRFLLVLLQSFHPPLLPSCPFILVLPCRHWTRTYSIIVPDMLTQCPLVCYCYCYCCCCCCAFINHTQRWHVLRERKENYEPEKKATKGRTRNIKTKTKKKQKRKTQKPNKFTLHNFSLSVITGL